jgi:hypothetical protein
MAQRVRLPWMKGVGVQNPELVPISCRILWVGITRHGRRQSSYARTHATHAHTTTGSHLYTPTLPDKHRMPVLCAPTVAAHVHGLEAGRPVGGGMDGALVHADQQLAHINAPSHRRPLTRRATPRPAHVGPHSVHASVVATVGTHRHDEVDGGAAAGPSV